MSYDIKKHGDFRKLYDTNQKRNYWLLGYFGGGAINICDAYELAKQYSKAVGVPLETVYIDEILSSRSYKHFKYISSTAIQTAEIDTTKYENVYQLLTN
ncbi:MAG: hypothetical protein WC389_14965 [Lutibacter sp.]|jgi:hypothetical protein